MFYGEFKHNFDPKGRLVLPSKFREVSKEYGIERFFITRGLDRCIFMFAEDEWRAVETKFRNMSFTKKETRSFNRMFFAGAVDVRPDKQGRFIMPDYLKEYAGIKRETMVIGVSHRIEIWDRNAYKDFYENSQNGYETLAENLLDL